jgi:hypothetical protein
MVLTKSCFVSVIVDAVCDG